MSRIVANTRFLHRPVSGVERYAGEIMKHVDLEYITTAPPWPTTGFTAHLWEQVYLPLSIKPGDLLWSPANTGPMLISRQVIHVYDLSPIDHPGWFKPAFASWYRWMWSILLPRARAIVTTSQFTKERLMFRFRLPAERISVIPGHANAAFKRLTAAEYQAACRRYGIDRPYLLFVGTLEPRKNLPGLFQAWRKVLTRHPEYHLLICGDQPRVHHSADINFPPPNVRLLGRVPDQDLPGLYNAAVCLVLPSWYEGFGFPVLEAMACGTPVIIARAGALPEVAGEAALQIDPHNPDDLAEALCRLIEDDHVRSELSERGLGRAAEYSWERSARDVRAVLQKARSP